MTITSNIPKNILKQLLEIFPNNISFGFAYGSGVFNQSIVKNGNKSCDNNLPKNMIDLIFSVDDSAQWHKNNILKNRNHYSIPLRYLGPKWLATIQEDFGAKVFFNTLVPIDDYIIKYGIISKKDLINDCLDWETLYISGRLHKPVQVIKQSNNNDLSNALKINNQSALHSALLLLSETFTEEQLYQTIAGLSYNGDFRMTFGEDKQKVLKIVRPQISNFRTIYQPLISSETMSQIVSWNPNSRAFSQDCSPNALLYHLNLLPKCVQHNLTVNWIQTEVYRDIDDVMQSLAHSVECKTEVKTVIQKIVWNSSWSQSFKGLFTAGILKSILYSSQKINKMFKSSKSRKI